MVRRFGPNFDIVHAQQIAMFSYLTGSLDYALSNPIFILERVTRFVVEYITANSHKKFIFRTIYFFSFFLFENLPMRARSSTRCTRVVRDVEILENLGKEAIMHKRYSRVASLELFSLSKHGKGKNSKNGRNETIYRDEISATICYLLPTENGRSFLVCCSPRPYPPHSLEQFRGRGEVFHTRRISFSIPWQKASSFAPNGIIKMAIKDLESISLPSRGETMESFSKVSQTPDELRTKLKLCQSYPAAIYSRSTVASFPVLEFHR